MNLSYHARFAGAYFCFQLTNTQKQYENKNEANRIAEDLDGHLSIHNVVPVFLRRTFVGASVVPAHVSSYDFPGAMDRIYRRTIGGRCHPHGLARHG